MVSYWVSNRSDLNRIAFFLSMKHLSINGLNVKQLITQKRFTKLYYKYWSHVLRDKDLIKHILCFHWWYVFSQKKKESFLRTLKSLIKGQKGQTKKSRRQEAKVSLKNWNHFQYHQSHTLGKVKATKPRQVR